MTATTLTEAHRTNWYHRTFVSRLVIPWEEQ